MTKQKEPNRFSLATCIFLFGAGLITIAYPPKLPIFGILGLIEFAFSAFLYWLAYL